MLRKAVGWALVASPFVAIATISTIMHGVGFTVAVFAATTILVAALILGVKLISN